MPIDGKRSLFPASLDSWGNTWANDDCINKPHAEDWNKIQDATLALERATLGVLLTGQSGVLTHPTSGATRPAVLYKTYTVTLTGADAKSKTAALSGFSTAEKALFAGTPLANGNGIFVFVRRRQEPATQAYIAGIISPISDTTGASGWSIGISPVRDQNDSGQVLVSAGTYVVTVMIQGRFPR